MWDGAYIKSLMLIENSSPIVYMITDHGRSIFFLVMRNPVM